MGKTTAHKSITEFRPCNERDRSAITEFLYSLRDDFLFSEKGDAAEVTSVLFRKGGAYAAWRGTEIVALCGYFFGDPADDYADPSVGYLYVAGAAPRYRLTRLMRDGLVFVSRNLAALGVRELRLQAAERNAYARRLYAKFADPIRQERNRRGHPTVLFAAPVDEVLVRLGA